MKIDVSEVLKAVGNELKVSVSEEVSYPEDNLILTRPVDVKLHLLNTGETILVTGMLKTAVRLTCSRCMKEFDSPISVDVEEEYTIKPMKPSKAKAVELKKEDFYFQIGEDKTIDLSEAVRQNLLTSLPIKPLCDKECRGIEIKKEK